MYKWRSHRWARLVSPQPVTSSLEAGLPPVSPAPSTLPLPSSLQNADVLLTSVLSSAEENVPFRVKVAASFPAGLPVWLDIRR